MNDADGTHAVQLGTFRGFWWCARDFTVDLGGIDWGRLLTAKGAENAKLACSYSDPGKAVRLSRTGWDKVE